MNLYSTYRRLHSTYRGFFTLKGIGMCRETGKSSRYGGFRLIEVRLIEVRLYNIFALQIHQHTIFVPLPASNSKSATAIKDLEFSEQLSNLRSRKISTHKNFKYDKILDQPPHKQHIGLPLPRPQSNYIRVVILCFLIFQYIGLKLPSES